MRRRVVAGLVGGAVAAVLVAGCGDPSIEEQLDAAELRIRDLEDRHRDLLEDTTPTTGPELAGPPPTRPTTTRPPTTLPPPTTAATTTSTAPPPAEIEAASAAAVRDLVGEARWDEGLPVPAACLSSASFSPSGPEGANGGTITCSVPFAPADVAAFVRRLNDERNLIATDNGQSFEYGGVASIAIRGAGSGSTFVATQSYE